MRFFNVRLHIYLIFTDIKIVLTLFLCVAALIFPLFLNIDLAYTGENAKLYFGVRLFGFIKVISGYAEKIKEGFAFHLSEKKAYILSYKSLTGAKESIKPFMDYHFIKIRTVIETGNSDDAVAPLAAAFASSYINGIVCRIFSFKKPYLVLDNSFNVYLDRDVFNVFMKIDFVFNLIMVISSVIKIITEKIIYAIRQRKNQN